MAKVKPKSLVDQLTKRQLVELDACTHCGICVDWCPAYSLTSGQNTPMDKLATYRNFVQKTHGLGAKIFGSAGIDEKELQAFSDDLYDCTSCGRCGVVCPVGIHCQELWPNVRAEMVQMGYGPTDDIAEVRRILEEKKNPFDMPYADRNNWISQGISIAKNADICFYVGCELAYRIPTMAVGAASCLSKGGIEFTIFDDEWCCGFPLYVLGDRGEEFRSEVMHNIEGLIKTGAKVVAPSCPCCYNVMQYSWPEVYGKPLPFKLVHILELVARLVQQGRLRFSKPFDGKVTYHDPCYLSRGWGGGNEIIEQPRQIIRGIPGLEFVEMEHHGRLSTCPGSGGGLRRTNKELSVAMSMPVIKEAEAAGASVLLTACPAVNERFRLLLNDGGYKTKLKMLDLLDFAGQHI